MDNENKQAKALAQFEQLRPEILKLFLGAPDYGFTSLTVHFHKGTVKRVVHGFEESIIPAENEH